jgi:hypothetical protein
LAWNGANVGTLAFVYPPLVRSSRLEDRPPHLIDLNNDFGIQFSDSRSLGRTVMASFGGAFMVFERRPESPLKPVTVDP